MKRILFFIAIISQTAISQSSWVGSSYRFGNSNVTIRDSVTSNDRDGYATDTGLSQDENLSDGAGHDILGSVTSGQTAGVGFTFEHVSIPLGATIVSATLTLDKGSINVIGGSSVDIVGRYSGVPDVFDGTHTHTIPTHFSATCGGLTSSTLWDATTSGVIDIASLIQELLNDNGGISTPFGIQLTTVDQFALLISDFTAGANLAAKINIVYHL